MKNLSISAIFIFLIAAVILTEADSSKLTDAQVREMMAMVREVNHATLPYKDTVIEQMVSEANYFSDRLNLPFSRPIRLNDVSYPHVSPPWFGIIQETNPPYHLPATVFGSSIYNTNIARETRLHALRFGVRGEIETTNFEFGFLNGKLSHVMRLSQHEVERYANNLDALIGKPSLIDTNGAYQLATQWLAAVDVDMNALNKLKWTVNQLHYKARGATNYVTLLLYYVDFGNKHTPAQNNLPASDEPLVSVEILGTTKELQELILHDDSFSRRPQMIITNALELIRTPGQPMEHPEPAAGFQTNWSSP